MLSCEHVLKSCIYIKLFFVCLITLSLSGCKSATELPVADGDNGGLFLPGGFDAFVVADSTGRARHIAVNDNGDIYVKLVSSDKKAEARRREYGKIVRYS